MGRLRDKLTYSNVMVTILAFVVLGGGAAYAASHLGKKSVGTKQLKSNAVTTAKIKKNAVTKAKIKAGSIDSSKIADGSVTGTDINASSTPFSRIVFETRGNSTVDLQNGSFAVYPLVNPTYTQSPGSDDTVLGALDVAFKPTCEKPRQIQVYVLADAANPSEVKSFNDAVGVGQFSDETGAVSGGRIKLGGYGGLLQPSAPTNHILSIVAGLHCNSGDGATATFGALDVIGTKK